jgi:hypothetical protein
LLIGSLRHQVDGNVGVGVLDLYVLRQQARARKQASPSRVRRHTGNK